MPRVPRLSRPLTLINITQLARHIPLFNNPFCPATRGRTAPPTCGAARRQLGYQHEGHPGFRTVAGIGRQARRLAGSDRQTVDAGQPGCRHFGRRNSRGLRPVAQPLHPQVQGEHPAVAPRVVAPAAGRQGHGVAARLAVVADADRHGMRLLRPGAFLPGVRQKPGHEPAGLEAQTSHACRGSTEAGLPRPQPRAGICQALASAASSALCRAKARVQPSMW